MGGESVFKVLFFLQSAAFVVFILYFSQTPKSTQPTFKTYGVQCKGSDIRELLGEAPAAVRADIIPLGPLSGENETSRSNDTAHVAVSIETSLHGLLSDGTNTSKPHVEAPVAVSAETLPRGGPLSNCTLADIMNRPGVMLLTTTNAAYMDMVLNMLESIKRTGVCVNTTVIAENRNVYQYLHKRAEGDPAVHVSLTNSGEMHSNEPSRRDRKAYYGLMNKRQAYLLAMLEQGLEVLFTDSDTFWFRDPFPYFKGDFDMSAMDPRSPYPTRTKGAHYCAGFVYYKPTKATIQLVKAWIEAMQGKTTPDQIVLNSLLQRNRPVYVNVQPIDVKLFPYGPKYYEFLETDKNYTCVVMHAASIRGHPAKVAKFKSSNMWLMDALSGEMLAQE